MRQAFHFCLISPFVTPQMACCPTQWFAGPVDGLINDPANHCVEQQAICGVSIGNIKKKWNAWRILEKLLVSTFALVFRYKTWTLPKKEGTALKEANGSRANVRQLADNSCIGLASWQCYEGRQKGTRHVAASSWLRVEHSTLVVTWTWLETSARGQQCLDLSRSFSHPTPLAGSAPDHLALFETLRPRLNGRWRCLCRRIVTG